MDKIWYFTYGKFGDLNKLKERKIKIYKAKKATARGYQVSFAKKGHNNPMELSATLGVSQRGEVEGLALLIDENDIKKLEKLERCPKNTRKINLNITFNDDSQKKIKSAITYVARDDYNYSFDDKGGTNYNFTAMMLGNKKGTGGPPAVITTLKNNSKNFTWNNNYVKTFEQYKEDLD